MPDPPKASTHSNATHQQVASAPRKSGRFDVFLSHNSEDKPDVDKIREKLEAAGIKVWFDLYELSGGDPLLTTLKRALQNSAACIVFIGSHGVGLWQDIEITTALKLKRPKRRIIPVFLPGSACELPASLKEKQLMRIEFLDFEDRPALDKLIKDIRTKVKDQSYWDRTRQALFAASVLISLMAIAWAMREFFTFQAEFAPIDYDQQRQEIVITRRFDPLPRRWRYRQGTWIFKDERRDQTAENQVNGRLKLNSGWLPEWSLLVPVLGDSRRRFAELEWFNRPVSDPFELLAENNVAGWKSAAPQPFIKALVPLLEKQDGDVRSRAAASLGQLGENDANAIKALRAMLIDEDSRVRSAAEKSLVLLGAVDTELINALVAPLNDRDAAIRSSAAEFLGQLGLNSSVVINELGKLLKDQDAHVRSASTTSLGKLGYGNEEVIGALIPLLDDEDEHVRYCVAESLVQLQSSSETLVDALVTLSKNQYGSSRSVAAQLMRKLGKSEDKVIDALLALVKDEHVSTRSEAATSLGKIGSNTESVIDALLICSRDQHSSVRSAAVGSLGQLNNSDRKVVDATVKCLADESPGVRSRAALSLGKLGNSDEAVIDALVACLKDQYSTVRIASVKSIVALGKENPAVAPGLERFLNADDGGVRCYVADAMVQLSVKSPAVLHTLVSLLKDPRADRRRGLTIESGESPMEVSERAAAALTLLGKGNSQVINTLVDVLVEVLHDDISTSQLRTLATIILGNLGQNNAIVIDAIVARLKDDDNTVRACAAASLGQLGKGDSHVIDALVARLKDQDNDVRACAVASLMQLGKSDPIVIEALVALLKDQDIDVRSSTAKAIGELAQGRLDWTDKRMIADLEVNDSSVRERAGIVLAFRRQKIDSEITPDEAQRLKDIRNQVDKLRKDARPWVKQASLHTLYHIEKRKAELEYESRK